MNQVEQHLARLPYLHHTAPSMLLDYFSVNFRFIIGAEERKKQGFWFGFR
jgi:hypothetical protein